MTTTIYSPSTLLEQLKSNGLIVQNLQFNKLVRTKTTDEPNSRNGWYIAYHSPVYMVFFGNWKTYLNNYFIGKDRELSEHEKGLINQRKQQHKEQKIQEKVEQWEKNRQKMEKVLRECTPIRGTVAGLYLSNRGVGLATNNQYEALLFHPHCEYKEDGNISYYPCLIAKVTDQENTLVALQFTYLLSDGRKASVKTPKKLMYVCGSLIGASIKLGEPKAFSKSQKVMGIAEGIENALSAGRIYDCVVWAALSDNGIKSFIPPTDVTKVIFYPNNGEVAIKTAEEAGERLKRLGVYPETWSLSRLSNLVEFNDWNEALMYYD